MNPTPKIFLMLLGATLIFHTALNYMIDNIEEFETVPLPPKKIKKISTYNPTIQVNAKTKDSWMLVNFATGKTQSVKDDDSGKKAFQNINWDLGFSRTKIISNGGATNPQGQTGAINLGAVDFDNVRKAPQQGYVKDKISFGSLINKELSDWYNYRTRTHNIESKKNVYIIKLADNRFMKMRILNYYCGKKDEDCRTTMCSRQQAACLTVEYVLSENGTNQFPLNMADSKIVSNIDSATNIN
ncbi:MAG: HmuY family protein [Nitrospinota bacterium]